MQRNLEAAWETPKRLDNPSAFFRVVRNNLASPKDADGDGLDDVFELDHQPGMDPLVAADPADSDFDGLSDWTESRYRSNPFAREWLSPIAAGARSSLALRSDSSLWGWGANNHGQLGLASPSVSIPDPSPSAQAGPWKGVAAHGDLAVAVHSNGSVWSWGSTPFFSLVAGPGFPPRRVGLDNDWMMVGCGQHHAVGLKQSGTLWTWGLNDFGQLGTDQVAATLTPTQIGFDSDWWMVATAGSYCVALKTNGTLWGWGDNSYGQLGDGTQEPRNTPAQTGSENGWFRVVAGATHCLAIQRNGSLWAWGTNELGNLGVGAIAESKVPIRVGQDHDWQEIWAGNRASFALKRDGSLWAWGDNTGGRLGLPLILATTDVPQRVGNENDWIAVSAGERHSLGLKRGGRLICWGEANQGQLGDGHFGSYLTPVSIDASTNWLSASAGGAHSLALKTDGSLWVWGDNINRPLGTGDDAPRPTPVRIEPEVDWVSVHAGGGYSSAIDSDGFAWFWGAVDVGGGGVPGKVTFSNPIERIAAGPSHALAIDSTGKLFGQGNNFEGALGTGSDEPAYPSFVAVAPSQAWQAVSAGSSFSLGIANNGLLWSWGWNHVGQLGNGTYLSRDIPSLVDANAVWSRVSAGGGCSLGLKTDGSLWSWGDNSFGQLGLGAEVTTTNVPVRVGLDVDWKEISAGYSHALAIKHDGTLWYWGRFPEFGAEVDPMRTTYQPQQLGNDSDWSKVSSMGRFAIMIKSDGSLWGWGDSTLGELGQPYARRIELGGTWGPGGP